MPWALSSFVPHTDPVLLSLAASKFYGFGSRPLEGPILDLDFYAGILTYTKLDLAAPFRPYLSIPHKNPSFSHFVRRSLGSGRVFHASSTTLSPRRPPLSFLSPLYSKEHLPCSEFFVYPKHLLSYLVTSDRLGILRSIHFYNGNFVSKKGNRAFAK